MADWEAMYREAEAEGDVMRAALNRLLAWDQMTPCCQQPEGLATTDYHNGHNPDIAWARKLIMDALSFNGGRH